MADAHVDIELVEDLALDYVEGAETGLPADLRALWNAVVGAFPGLTLSPLFSSVDLDALADMVDIVRMAGDEPPNPFTSFAVACDEAVAASVHDAIAALPFVVFAEVRPIAVNATVVGYGTNAEMASTFQVLRAPGGVDAIHGWQIEGGTGPGIRFSDIENSWDLNHEDLLAASVQRSSTFGVDPDPTHGTAVLGIVLSGDNGVGIVGIAPDAQGFLVTTTRADGSLNPAAAVTAAAAAARPGGVVLIEQGTPFFANGGPDVLWEFNLQTQKAIRLATFFGITVVEPAGNGGVNLDAFPFFAHVQPSNPAFVDSRAIVVGAGGPSGEVANPTWQRSSFSTFGSRVDCFAAGVGVRAPSTAPSTYQNFAGTSSASAIIAGVCCSILGMANAAGLDLLPTDIRRLLRDPSLGTPTAPGAAGGIGSMPDLRRIARQLGAVRALPVSLLSQGADAMTLVHLDDDDTLVRREWRSATLWGDRIPLAGADATFLLAPQQPAALASIETDVPRTVVDVVALGRDGDVHHVFWDTLGQLGSNLAKVRAPHDTLANGRDVATVRPLVDTLVIVGIDPAGRLVSLQGDASLHLATGLSNPVLIDPVATFRRCAGPALVTHNDGTMDVVAIDDGGNMRAARGTSIATIGTGWAPPVTLPAGVVLDPAVRPALITTPFGLVAIAADTNGVLQFAELSLVPPVSQPFAPIDASFTLAGRSPVALAANSTQLAAIAVGSDLRLHFAFRSIAAGSPWSTLDPIDADVAVHRLGGVSATVVDDTFAVAAILADGRPCWSRFMPGTGWLSLRAA